MLKIRSLICAAMCDKLTPLVHLKVRAREILADQLAYEGVSEDGRAQADGLAIRMWDFATADQLMLEMKEAFPEESFNELLRFCKREYPVLYSALPVSITGESLQLFRSKCQTVFQLGSEQAAAVEQLANFQVRGSADSLVPVPSPGSTGDKGQLQWSPIGGRP